MSGRSAAAACPPNATVAASTAAAEMKRIDGSLMMLLGKFERNTTINFLQIQPRLEQDSMIRAAPQDPTLYARDYAGLFPGGKPIEGASDWAR